MYLGLTLPNLRLSRLISLVAALMDQYFFNTFLETSQRRLFRSFWLLSTATLSSAVNTLNSNNLFLMSAGTFFNPAAAI